MERGAYPASARSSSFSPPQTPSFLYPYAAPLHGSSRGLGDSGLGGPRTDTDFTVVKLSPGGVIDGTFGTGGMHRLDQLGEEANATARGLKIVRSLPRSRIFASWLVSMVSRNSSSLIFRSAARGIFAGSSMPAICASRQAPRAGGAVV